MWYRWLTGALVLLLVGASVAAAQGGYLQPFDGAPPAPQPYPSVPGLAAWDVTVHSRDPSTFAALEPMEASHGPGCEAPPATHHLAGAYSDAVFQCNNHIMTAIKATGYGVLYLTPPVVVDFTDGPATIQFDVSTARTSYRDWLDLWVSPQAEQLQLPLDDWLPDLVGVPRNALRARMNQFTSGTDTQTSFGGSVVRNFVEAGLPENIQWPGYEAYLTPSAAVRTTFQWTISRTHMKFGMPAYNVWWFDADIADLGWTQGVLQLGHHSYTPDKDCPPDCAANTWHWDNLSVSPSLPFTITRATTAQVDQSTDGLVTFPTPASPGEHLRFVGLGNTYEYSLDGGSTWQPVALQPAERVDPFKHQSYWQPVPAGTQQVRLRAQGGWWGSYWMARDFSFWSQVGVPPSQRTPTPTAVVPTRTPTVPPTLTSGPTATLPPTPTTLPTLTPTVPTVPTATPTSPPRCGRWDVINGGVVFTPYADAQCMQ